MKQAGLQERGFALLEALITAAVVAVGLLGVMRLQLLTITQTHHGYLNYQAMTEIYDMADRMRANSTGISAGYYNAVTTMPSSPPNCNGSVNCTPQQLANYDISQWMTNVAATLPSGTGSVTGSGAGSTFKIQVHWTERALGARQLAMSFRM